MTMRTAIMPMLLALCVMGCAATPTPDISAFAARSANNSFEVFDRAVDSDGLVLPVVHDRQTTPASCGAHALASIVNYWSTPGRVSGDALFAAAPPREAAQGYSLTELAAMARQQGLLANAARLAEADIVRELERGRPVLVPISAPAVYLEPRTLPGQNAPVVGFFRNLAVSRAARISEVTGAAMINHYVVVVGYQDDRFVVVEPVQGFRTISFERLARYREAFNNAALVFSPSPPATGR